MYHVKYLFTYCVHDKIYRNIIDVTKTHKTSNVLFQIEPRALRKLKFRKL